MCDHPSCAGQAFSVFNSRLELMEHKLRAHGERETISVTPSPSLSRPAHRPLRRNARGTDADGFGAGDREGEAVSRGRSERLVPRGDRGTLGGTGAGVTVHSEGSQEVRALPPTVRGIRGRPPFRGNIPRHLVERRTAGNLSCRC